MSPDLPSIEALLRRGVAQGWTLARTLQELETLQMHTHDVRETNSANYLSETDFLAEAGQILRGETMKAATIDHLQALAQLVTVAQPLLVAFEDQLPASPRHEAVADWLQQAEKVSK